MKNKYIKQRSQKTLTEQVEEHFRYMASKGWHKNKLRSYENALWRPEKKLKSIEEEYGK